MSLKLEPVTSMTPTPFVGRTVIRARAFEFVEAEPGAAGGINHGITCSVRRLTVGLGPTGGHDRYPGRGGVFQNSERLEGVW